MRTGLERDLGGCYLSLYCVGELVERNRGYAVPEFMPGLVLITVLARHASLAVGRSPSWPVPAGPLGCGQSPSTATVTTPSVQLSSSIV